MLLTTGEQVSIALCAMAISAAGENAISLTAAQVGRVTDSAHTQARIRHINKERIQAELANDRIVICAGFQGIDLREARSQHWDAGHRIPPLLPWRRCSAPTDARFIPMWTAYIHGRSATGAAGSQDRHNQL